MAGIVSMVAGTVTEVGMVVDGMATPPGIQAGTIGTVARTGEVGAAETPGTPAEAPAAVAGTVALAVQLADGMAVEVGVAAALAEA